jgi:hypothetical protein
MTDIFSSKIIKFSKSELSILSTELFSISSFNFASTYFEFQSLAFGSDSEYFLNREINLLILIIGIFFPNL